MFSTEDLALKACTTDRHFLGPVKLDEWLPDRTIDWPGARYPLATKA